MDQRVIGESDDRSNESISIHESKIFVTNMKIEHLITRCSESISPPIHNPNITSAPTVNRCPLNFDTDAYRFYNADLRNFSNEQLIEHYLIAGINENRLYYFGDEIKKLNIEMLKDYTNSPNINMNDVLIQKLDFKNIKSHDNVIIFLGHALGGGLSKYIYDLLHNRDKVKNFADYILVSNEFSAIDTDILYVNHESIFDFIDCSKTTTNRVILHVNIFPNFTSYSIDSIRQIYNSFFEKNIQVILTIHDFFYLSPQSPNMLGMEYDCLKLSQTHIAAIDYIFENAFQIIFPTHQCLDKHIKKGIAARKNFIVSPHIDIDYNDYIERYDMIDEEIRILFLGDQSNHKGYHIVDFLANNNVQYDGKPIKYFYMGRFHGSTFPQTVSLLGEYDYFDAYNKINMVKPHLCLCVSSFYETYSYTTSIILKLGLPIFYNIAVYSERLADRKNIYGYDSEDSMEQVSRKFTNCLSDLIYKGSDVYQPIDPSMILYANDFYTNEFCKYASYENLEDEVIKYIQKMDRNETMVHNLVIVTSKIFTTSLKPSYTSNRTIYTPIERLAHTIDTINSIRKYIPSSYIILIDNSDFTNYAYMKNQLSICDLFLNPCEQLILSYNTNSLYKQISEGSQLKYVLEYIKYHKIQYKNLFKISGGCVVNDSYDQNVFEGVYNIFKKNTSVKDRDYYTCFYKISHTSFEKYHIAINNMLNNALNDSDFAKNDFEAVLEKLMDKLFEVDTLGITQNISVWDDMTNI